MPASLNPAASVCTSNMARESHRQPLPVLSLLPEHLSASFSLTSPGNSFFFLTSRLRPALACSGRYSMTSHLPPSSHVSSPLCLIREVPTLTSGPQRVSGAERTGPKGACIQISTVCEHRQRGLKAIKQTLRQGRSYVSHSTRFQSQGCETEAPSFLSVVHSEQATSILVE